MSACVLRALSGGAAFVLLVASVPILNGQTTYYVNGTCGDDAWTGTNPSEYKTADTWSLHLALQEIGSVQGEPLDGKGPKEIGGLSLRIEGQGYYLYSSMSANTEKEQIKTPWKLRELQDQMVKYYEARDAIEPGKGYAEKAANWRKNVEGLCTDPVKTLARWLEKELPAIHAGYGKPEKDGIVLAIGPGRPTNPALVDWETANVSRKRSIAWVSSDGNQSISSSKGRPYSFFHEAYFGESFRMPYREAVRISILKGETPRPGFICVLTTDAHLLYRFRVKYKEHLRKSRKIVRETPARGAGEWLMGHFSLLALNTLQSLYESIDLKLMHLQRRETLIGAIISTTVKDESRRSELLRKLRKETDDAWKTLYFARPFE